MDRRDSGREYIARENRRLVGSSQSPTLKKRDDDRTVARILARKRTRETRNEEAELFFLGREVSVRLDDFCKLSEDYPTSPPPSSPLPDDQFCENRSRSKGFGRQASVAEYCVERSELFENV